MNESKYVSARLQGSTDHTPPSKNVAEIASSAGNLTTLATAIRAAGLTDKLTGKGPLTLFAPSDEAFKKLPAGALEALLKDSAKLRAVLSYHVVAGHLTTRDMKSGEMMTLQGSTLTASVSSAGLEINLAHVKQADIAATNGVVHIIDAVIMPKNWKLQEAA
jgi:uncharacterized surface protein with fasciclin (FAS1) repeats